MVLSSIGIPRGSQEAETGGTASRPWFTGPLKAPLDGPGKAGPAARLRLLRLSGPADENAAPAAFIAVAGDACCELGRPLSRGESGPLRGVGVSPTKAQLGSAQSL